MPALLVLLVVVHLLIFRHNGGAGPPSDVDRKKLPQGRFWPNQMFMDAVASALVFLVMFLLACFQPAPLDDKADPTNSSFVPYPAWYFLALYGLLRLAALVPHEWAPVANLLATVVIPGALVTVLILLPFIDRNPSRRISKRPWIMGVTALSVIGAVGLSLYSQSAIMQEQTASGPRPAAAAQPSGGTLVAASERQTARRSSSQNCASCHGAQGQGAPGAFPAPGEEPRRRHR